MVRIFVSYPLFLILLLLESEDSAKNITIVNKESNINNISNDPKTSRLALNIQSSGLEPLNLIDLKNNKFRRPKAKFNKIIISNHIFFKITFEYMSYFFKTGTFINKVNYAKNYLYNIFIE